MLTGNDQAAAGAARRQTSKTSPTGKRRLNIVAIVLNIFGPWLMFCAVFATLSFHLHYTSPAAAWSIVGLAFVVVGLLLLAAMHERRQRAASGTSRVDPMWLLFSVLATGTAVVLATALGDMNFWFNMQPFYDIENLNSYPSVDPSRESGQQLMDAGRVYFAEGTKLDVKKSMGFKNLNLYCVAPIVKGDQQLATYDFWAVGVDCCSGVSADFRCGEYNNQRARSGMRLMRDDQRPFFRLAVQQAEAAYNLKAQHPLFFYFMQDPVKESNMYRDAGLKNYLLGMFSHFAFNLFAVVCATLGFSKWAA